MSYNFPVSLQDIYTKSGKQVPRYRAVVRDDTDEPIATVSTKYKLIEHATVMGEAMKYVQKLGNPTEKFYTSTKGDRAVGEFTYADKTLAVRKGDMVGLRVYAESSYNGKQAIKVRIGGLRLVCMNGLMQPNDIFSLNVKHTGDVEFKFPEPEEIMERFTKTIHTLSGYSQMELGSEKIREYAEMAVNEGVVVERAVKAIKDEDRTVWDLYNHFTYHITHNESSKASYLGKMNRLNRVASWIEEKFPLQ